MTDTQADLMERAALFYERQGYDFGLDNIDIIRMIAEFAQSERGAAAVEWRGKYEAMRRDVDSLTRTMEAMNNQQEAEVEAAAAEARRALDESVKLQSHYARLLNDYDGGQRMTFASADEWIARLAALASPAPQEP